jgi:hypothetical protein
MFSARSNYLLCLAWLATFVVVTSAAPAIDQFAAVPSMVANGEQGVLLLHDGGALVGKISLATDMYVVVRAGSELQIAPSRVSFVGRTMRDAYEFRCTHLPSDTIEAHLALADWCLRQNLLMEAEGELTIARNLQADHPRLLLLERRLVATKDRNAALKTPASVTPSSPPKIVSDAPTNSKSPATSAIMPDLPDGVVENFTRKVQPVLVNNCTAAKCHEPGGQQAFQLNRAILRGEANRRTTMQNLAATMTLVDRENPEKSRLLTLPRQTHAGMNGPIMGPRQDQAFQHLADWVALIAPPKPATEDQVINQEEVAATIDADGRLHLAKTAITPPAERMAPPAKPLAKSLTARGSTRSIVPNAEHTNVDASVQPASATEDGDAQTLRPPHRLRFGATVAPWQPRDPYDPEIFNRRQRAPIAPTK